MHRYRITEILSTFSDSDIRKFREYLNSPLFNKSEKLLKLYEALIVNHPHFNSEKLKAEIIFKKVNPGAAFNISTFRNLMSDLSGAAENFMSVVNFCKSDFQKQECLRDELFKRKLERILGQNIKKCELMFSEKNIIDSDYFIDYFKFSVDVLNYNQIFKPVTGTDAVSLRINLLTEHGKNLIKYFAKEISRIYDNLNVMKKTYDINEENNIVLLMLRTIDFGKFLSLLSESSGNEKESLIFRLHHANFLAFSNMDNTKYYFDYKNLILKNAELLGIEIRLHSINLIRYCMLKKKSAKTGDNFCFDKERFEIYNLILENKFYKSDVSADIPVELFRTVLLLGLELKKYSWVYKFIRKYKSEILPDKRENMYLFACSVYYFHRGKFTEALKSINKIKPDHFMLKIDLRNLMLRLYYELSLFDNALSLIDSYRHFLSKEKTLSVSEKKIYKNFLNTVYKMIKYRISACKSVKDLPEFELSIELPHKEWLKEKITELNRKHLKSA